MGEEPISENTVGKSEVDRSNRQVEIFEDAYYDRLKALEGTHWWVLGMTDVMQVLLSEHLPQTPDTTFLDIGCGSGVGLSWAAGAVPDARRLGTDISRHALEHCRGLGALLSLADAQALPYRSGSVDVAICVDVLQHLEDDLGALQEAHRVLRPGGMLYVRTNARGLPRPPAGSRLFSKGELQQRLELSGLKVQLCSRINVAGSLAELVRIWLSPGKRMSGAHEHQEFSGGGYSTGIGIEPAKRQSLADRMKRVLLQGEARAVKAGLPIFYGHSLVAVAQKMK